MTEDEIAKEIMEQMPVFLKEEFCSLRPEQLSQTHNSLGRYIRNRYKLWDAPWERQIVSGMDISPDHPDAVSMRIVEIAHRIVNQKE